MFWFSIYRSKIAAVLMFQFIAARQNLCKISWSFSVAKTSKLLIFNCCNLRERNDLYEIIEILNLFH